MSDLVHLWGIFLGTFIGLLPAVYPLSAAPMFLAITEGQSDGRRHQQARQGCLYMVAILLSFLIGGRFIMTFFGISIPGIHITGGILLTGIGTNLLAAHRSDIGGDTTEREAARQQDGGSFSPLAIPMLSGPGSIAVTLGFTSLAAGWADHIAIIGGIVAMAILTYAVLRLAGPGMKWIGPVGVNAMTRIMGFLTMCIGVQFV